MIDEEHALNKSSQNRSQTVFIILIFMAGSPLSLMRENLKFSPKPTCLIICILHKQTHTQHTAHSSLCMFCASTHWHRGMLLGGDAVYQWYLLLLSLVWAVSIYYGYRWTLEYADYQKQTNMYLGQLWSLGRKIVVDFPNQTECTGFGAPMVLSHARTGAGGRKGAFWCNLSLRDLLWTSLLIIDFLAQNILWCKYSHLLWNT